MPGLAATRAPLRARVLPSSLTEHVAGLCADAYSVATGRQHLLPASLHLRLDPPAESHVASLAADPSGSRLVATATVGNAADSADYGVRRAARNTCDCAMISAVRQTARCFGRDRPSCFAVSSAPALGAL